MSLEIEGKIYYQTSETCKQLGISRATLIRWLRAGILEKHHTDRRGWRLFTEEDLNKIHAEARKIQVVDSYQGGRNGKGSCY